MKCGDCNTTVDMFKASRNVGGALERRACYAKSLVQGRRLSTWPLSLDTQDVPG